MDSQDQSTKNKRKRGRPLLLTESMVKYYAEQAKSNREAARLAGVHFETWDRIARRLYYDPVQGITYYQHLRQKYKDTVWKYKDEKKWKYDKERYEKIKQGTWQPYKAPRLVDILAGKHPEVPHWKVKQMILRDGKLIPHQCLHCGYNLSRLDGRKPLILDRIDWKYDNHRIENLRFLCYNCFFMVKGLVPKKALEFGKKSIYKWSKDLESFLENEDKLIQHARKNVGIMSKRGLLYLERRHRRNSKENDLKKKTVETIGDEVRREAQKLIKSKHIDVDRVIHDLESSINHDDEVDT